MEIKGTLGGSKINCSMKMQMRGRDYRYGVYFPSSWYPCNSFQSLPLPALIEYHVTVKIGNTINDCLLDTGASSLVLTEMLDPEWASIGSQGIFGVFREPQPLLRFVFSNSHHWPSLSKTFFGQGPGLWLGSPKAAALTWTASLNLRIKCAEGIHLNPVTSWDKLEIRVLEFFRKDGIQ